MITQYKLTQTMALDYATNPSNLYLNPYKDSLLNAIAIDEWPAAAYAKSLLYLIKGEQLGFVVPIMPRESSQFVQKSDTKDESVKIYPNPASHELIIEAKKDALLSKIEINSLQGSLIKSFSCNASKITIDTDFIPDGMYYIKIIFDDHNSTSQLIQILH